MGIASNDSVLQFKQTLERRIANGITKSRLERITERAVEIFTKYRDTQVHDLFPLLSKFRFKADQKRSLHAAITGAAEESPQVERLLVLKIPFRNYSKQYTLKFADGELQTSKAELFAYGDYFKTFLSSKMNRRLRAIDLSEIVRVKDVTLISRVRKLLGSKAVYTEPMSLEKETFATIIAFIRGEVEIDFDDPDTYETIKAISGYFQIVDVEKLYCKNIAQAIAFVRNFGAQEIDLTKYEGDLTDKQINQILALPSLRKAGDVIDLKALFPKLSILDESVWNAHADMAAHGLKVDATVDQRVAIKNLHDMFRRLKIEGGAGITLLTMPAGLTLNKLLAIAKKPLQGNAAGCCSMWDQVVNQYGDAAILKAYTIALTNSVLDKSKGLSSHDQLKLVKKEGCKMAGFLDLMTLNLLTYIASEESKTRLYGDNPWTYSRAAEMINLWYVVVGGFVRSGLIVNSIDDDGYGSFGVAAARKFN